MNRNGPISAERGETHTKTTLPAGVFDTADAYFVFVTGAVKTARARLPSAAEKRIQDPRESFLCFCGLGFYCNYLSPSSDVNRNISQCKLTSALWHRRMILRGCAVLRLLVYLFIYFKF